MELKEKIKRDLLTKATKLNNKYPPISDRSNDRLRVQKIVKIFQLKEDYQNFYLIITKPKNDNKEKKYYLALVIAVQSSDLLVKIAKKLVSNEGHIQLIQFAFHPKHFRVSLAFLRELEELMDIDDLKNKLNSLRTKFLMKLNNIIN
jgi:hypothetical protein